MQGPLKSGVGRFPRRKIRRSCRWHIGGSGACGDISGSGSGGGGGPALTSSAYYRRMRLHTASTLDLPVRKFYSNRKQQFVCSKDLRTNTWAWSHPLRTHTLLSERYKNHLLQYSILPFLRASTLTNDLLRKVGRTQTF